VSMSSAKPKRETQSFASVAPTSAQSRSSKSPRQGRVQANGIEFAFLELGTGPLALCLHGFPDTARTWRYLLPELAEAGYRAVAPFMRGYAPSGLSKDRSYGLNDLAGDAVALHETLGGDEQAVLIGHDWGAETTYEAALLAPTRWSTLVTLAVPPAALDDHLFADYDQLKRFFYLFFFRTETAEVVVSKDEMLFLERLWSDWSPGYDATEDLASVRESLTERDHLAAALAYYRSESEQQGPYLTVPQPTLYLHGARDGCIDVAHVSGCETYLGAGSRVVLVQEAGHFLHLERPDFVNEHVINWVTSATPISSTVLDPGD